MKIEIQYLTRKTLILTVSKEGKVLVKSPKHVSEKYILNFVESKKPWIQKKLTQISQSQKSVNSLNLENLDIKKQKKQAKVLITTKMEYWSQIMQLKYTKLKLSSAQTHWGSCTTSNTISINWRLSLLPTELLD